MQSCYLFIEYWQCLKPKFIYTLLLERHDQSWGVFPLLYSVIPQNSQGCHKHQ